LIAGLKTGDGPGWSKLPPNKRQFGITFEAALDAVESMMVWRR
jgi:hypothetical protein